MVLIPKFVAHTPSEADPERWQSMNEHINGVADLAVRFATEFSADELARYSSILHDVGKYGRAFQQYLFACDAAKRNGTVPPKPGSAEHKSAGAKLILSDPRDPVRRMIAGCILGHHGGLPALGPGRLEAILSEHQNPLEMDESIEIARRERLDIVSLQVARPQDVKALANIVSFHGSDKLSARQDFEMLSRLVFSCLVDADALDTEKHFNPDKTALRTFPSLTENAKEWLGEVTEFAAKKQAGLKEGHVKRVRSEVLQACIEAGKMPPGLFSLTVPTGTLERLLTCGNPLIEMRAARTIMQSARKSTEMAETKKQLKDTVHTGAKQNDQITKLLAANKNYVQSRQEFIELKHSLRHGSFKRPEWISAYTWDNIVNQNKTSPQRTYKALVADQREVRTSNSPRIGG